MKGITSFAAILLGLVVAPALQAQDVAVQVKEKKTGLLAQATVKPDSARTIALAQVPGGKVSEFEIEEENDRLVYELKIVGQDGEKREIYVDARTGEIVTFDKPAEPAVGARPADPAMGVKPAEPAAKPAEPAAMGAGMSEGEPGLLAQATVKPDSAEAIALKEVPGGTITKRQIERKDAKLVYSFEIKVEGKDYPRTVRIDALTGAVIKTEGQ